MRGHVIVGRLLGAFLELACVLHLGRQVGKVAEPGELAVDPLDGVVLARRSRAARCGRPARARGGSAAAAGRAAPRPHETSRRTLSRAGWPRPSRLPTPARARRARRARRSWVGSSWRRSMRPPGRGRKELRRGRALRCHLHPNPPGRIARRPHGGRLRRREVLMPRPCVRGSGGSRGGRCGAGARRAGQAGRPARSRGRWCRGRRSRRGRRRPA